MFCAVSLSVKYTVPQIHTNILDLTGEIQEFQIFLFNYFILNEIFKSEDTFSMNKSSMEKDY